jgi:hypothetical protein
LLVFATSFLNNSQVEHHFHTTTTSAVVGWCMTT